MAVITPPARVGLYAGATLPPPKRSAAKPRRKPRKLPSPPKPAMRPMGLINR